MCPRTPTLCRSGCVLRVALIAVLTLMTASAWATTFTVTSTSDSGPGSLRQAMEAANATPIEVGEPIHNIVFNIAGGGVHSIQPLSALPPVTNRVVIDGYTQPGASAITRLRGTDAVLRIEIDGSWAGFSHGFAFGAPGSSRIAGLVINRFAGSAILVGRGSVSIEGNYVGTNAAGDAALGNGAGLSQASGAIQIQAFSGFEAFGYVGNTGGSADAMLAGRNLISGNAHDGVRVGVPGTRSFAAVHGNYIGSNAAGTGALGNGGSGVVVTADAGLTGSNGETAIRDNLIVANAGHGVNYEGTLNVNAISVSDNRIGAGLNGEPLGNGGHGLRFGGSSLGSILGNFDFTPTGLNPLIANNGGAGAFIDGNALVDVIAQFAGNAGLGIDIAPLGVNPNDPLDADTGPSAGQNYPVLTSVVSDSSSLSTTVQGSIHTTPDTRVEIRLYQNDVCDLSGFGEGQQGIALGQLSPLLVVTTDAAGTAGFSHRIGFALPPGKFMTATSRVRIEQNGLFRVVGSEFSACRLVQGAAALGTVQLSSDAYGVDENAGTVQLVVTRSGGSSGAVRVELATSDATAQAPGDFTSTRTTVNFADGDTANKTVSVPILDDASVEGAESFGASLSNASGASLGTPAAATVTISDNDIAPPPGPGTLQFSAMNFSVTENGGTATITVTRTGGSAGVIGVVYATRDGSALASSDFTQISGGLAWNDGDSSPKTFTVAISDDLIAEGAESLGLTLSNPIGGATLGSPSSALLEIADDDLPPGGAPTISIADVSVREGSGGLNTRFNFTVRLSAASSTPISVRVATSNGTAVSGILRRDYIRTTGTLVIPAGETRGTITVRVVPDRRRERDETFRLRLSSPVGATIADGFATGTIVNDD